MEHILSQLPFVRVRDDFLTPEECQQIIDEARPSLVAGQVVSRAGENMVDMDVRSAETTTLTLKKSEIAQKIYQRVSEYTGYPAESFEGFTVTHYNEGDYFRNHQDYFIWVDDPEYEKNNAERFTHGGNRISTVILYLNDVEYGGETYFPWIDQGVVPKTGRLVQFDYGYDDWKANISSQHLARAVRKGEKWIVTIWIREQDIQKPLANYKDFKEESTVIKRIENGYFDLEVGPDYDRRKMNLILPANDDILNTIIVGFTGGMDSALLLYLLASLNSYQAIPYKIQPVAATGYFYDESQYSIKEDWVNLEHMLKVIRGLTGSYIRDVKYVGTPPNSKPENHVCDGLMSYWCYSEKNGYGRNKEIFRHRYIYTGCTEMPTDNNPRWANMYTRHKSPLEFWQQPFINLQKYHILDCIYQLGLEEILEHTQLKCGRNHKDLHEHCDFFACNERRWAFAKLGLYDEGDKYCITGRDEHGNFRN